MKVYVALMVLLLLVASAGPTNICLARARSSVPSRTASGAPSSISVSNIADAAHAKPSEQTPVFQVKFSEPFAVFNFVNSISSKFPDNPFKKLFSDSKFNEEKYKALIAEYERLNIDYNYQYTEYPYGHKEAGSTGALLGRNLVNSHTINDFRLSSFGIIPNASLLKLSSILAEFVPVYRELVYQPNKERFETQLAEIKNQVAAKDIASYFSTGIRFYNSSWDNSVPFNFIFYPLPNSRGFMATVFYNNAVSALPTGLTDYNGLLSVMLHEIFHTLMDEQSLAFKKDLDKWFVSNPSRNSRYALILAHEALATSLGNGYVLGKLNGKENERNWYNRKYVNLMAKKIYPMVKDYAEKQQPIDQAFVDNYIKIFDDNFSDWLSEADFLMTASYVLSDNSEDFNVINQKFPYRPEQTHVAHITNSSVGKMSEVPITKVVVVSKENKNKLQLIKQNFAELRDWKPNAKTDFTHSVFLKDKTYLLIINSVRKTTGAQLETLKVK